MNETFTLTSEYIQLNQLLKICDLAETGGHAKAIINKGIVYVNKNQEFRIRNKLFGGEVVTIPRQKISITITKPLK